VFGWGGLGFGLGEHSAVSTQLKDKSKSKNISPQSRKERRGKASL
jgi:hypothetical protein